MIGCIGATQILQPASHVWCGKRYSCGVKQGLWSGRCSSESRLRWIASAGARNVRAHNLEEKNAVGR
jgi:hypothetical protein